MNALTHLLRRLGKNETRPVRTAELSGRRKISPLRLARSARRGRALSTLTLSARPGGCWAEEQEQEQQGEEGEEEEEEEEEGGGQDLDRCMTASQQINR